MNNLNFEAHQLGKMLENVISDKTYEKLVHLDGSPQQKVSRKREDLFSDSQVLRFFANQLEASEDKLSAEPSREDSKLVNFRDANVQQPSAI